MESTEMSTDKAPFTATKKPELQPPNPAITRPSYRVYDHRVKDGEAEYRPGVWYHGKKQTKDGLEVPIDKWICTPLHIDAVASLDQGSFGRLLRFTNSNGHPGEWCMPMAMLSGNGDSMRGVLFEMGVVIDPGSRSHLNGYLTHTTPSKRVIGATSTGWHNEKLFILPRQTFGDGAVCFQSESPTSDDYEKAGTLDGWRDSIGASCQGNPAMIFALAVSMAGPLLKILNKQGGGFNFVNRSSRGKSTALRAAASVWGGNDTYSRTWNSTANGLEGLCASRNDTCLILDELGEANGRSVGGIVYAIANGTGRQRASQSGAAKAVRRWRLMMLSSGEITLESKMSEEGKAIKAGQQLRLLDVPVNRKSGVFDSVDNPAAGAALADSITDAASINYGHAGPAFIQHLLTLDAESIRTRYTEIRATLGATDSQTGRAADRFAVVALAGEIAIDAGLLPVEHGAGIHAGNEMYLAWREDRGQGDGETRQILESVRDFIETQSARFSKVDGHLDYQLQARAGWWADSDGGVRQWLFNSGGLKAATAGHDVKQALRALDAAGWLGDRDSKRLNKNTHVLDLNGKARLYYVTVGDID